MAGLVRGRPHPLVGCESTAEHIGACRLPARVPAASTSCNSPGGVIPETSCRAKLVLLGFSFRRLSVMVGSPEKFASKPPTAEDERNCRHTQAAASLNGLKIQTRTVSSLLQFVMFLSLNGSTQLIPNGMSGVRLARCTSAISVRATAGRAAAPRPAPGRRPRRGFASSARTPPVGRAEASPSPARAEALAFARPAAPAACGAPRLSMRHAPPAGHGHRAILPGTASRGTAADEVAPGTKLLGGSSSEEENGGPSSRVSLVKGPASGCGRRLNGRGIWGWMWLGIVPGRSLLIHSDGQHGPN